MKFLKNGFLGIISFMCMIVIAGYINYEYNAEREQNLGQTVYVLANEGEIINAKNDASKKENERDNYYLYTKEITNNSFLEITENIKKIKEKVMALDENVSISYDFENNCYIVLVNKSVDLEEVKKSINIDGVIIKYLKEN
ncbi:MAG: hypothetical protein IJ809_01335 [Clostridia bacterium]|nr:hypothetical protein [Clostridia bacterium]